MLAKDINGVATTYNYNADNQLIEEVTNGVTIGYSYNANGDLVEKTTGEQYTYDIQGNLTSINGNGIDKEYTYIGNGNRLSETTDGETVYYVNDVNRRYEEVLQTYDQDGNTINTYTYGLQRIDSKGQTNETYLYDGRGSVVGAVDNSNQFVSYSYTAYGELMPSSPTPNVFGYNGEATNFETGLQYLRARYYDTTVQRFVQEDDYRGDYTNPISMNRYAYVHGNPVMGIDPSGYSTLDDYAYQKAQKSYSAYRTTTVNSYNFYMDYYTKKANTKESLTYTEGYDISKIYSHSTVSKPYTISPSQFSGNVYNCLKDIEAGKDLAVDSLTSDELDELYDATVDIYEHYESIKDLLDENDGELQAYSALYSTYYKASFTVEDRVNYVERNYPNGLYSTFDESALEAYKDTYPITDATKFETGGTLYSVNTSAGKLYSYTDSVINTNNDPHSVQPMKTLKDVPKDGSVEGYYHNHVNSSNLSGGDITFANNQNTILTGGMPDGSLKMVDPLGTITLVGNVNLSALPALSQSEKDKLVKKLEEDWNNHIAYEKSVNSDSDPTNDTFECYKKYPAWPN